MKRQTILVTYLLTGLLAGATTVEASWFRNTEQEAALKLAQSLWQQRDTTRLD